MNERTEAAILRAQRRVGTTLGKYRVERVLGIGGMAAVYLAVHRNGHKVAVKVLNPELAVDADARARFVREAYAANAIEHSGVARVIDDDVTEDGEPFLVMDLLEGETLQERIRRSGGKIPTREVLALASRLLGVVAAAHDKGILHRDLKPDNVFVTSEGAVKVLDFGVARVALPESGSDPTRTGRLMGTPAFMSPEQAFGKTREVDARSDLWSVGATMFTCLSGVHVHDAENASQLLVIAATHAARSLAAVEPTCPQPVVAVVDRACAFDRNARYPDARAMQAAVDAAHRALFGADVSQPLPALPSAREVFASAPTIASSPSVSGSSATKPYPAQESDGAPKKPRGRRLLALGGIALCAGIGIAFASWRRASTPPASVATAPVPSATPVRARPVLESQDCIVLARPEDVAGDATIWIGAMFARTGPLAAQFDGALRSVDLARRDFLDVTSGLPAVRAGGPPRPIGVVACDDALDAHRAARHLVEDVGVPAILGFSRSKEVVDLAAAYFEPRHVVAFATNTAGMLSAIRPPPGEPRMVWRTTFSNAAATEVSAAIVRDVLEAQLRKEGVLKPDEPMRVAFVNVDNATGIGNTDAVLGALRFNGKSAAENGENFLQVLIHDDDHGDPREENERVVRALLAMRPHVIIDAIDGDYVTALERAWGSGPRPRYTPAPDADALMHDPAFTRRIVDVDSLSDTPASAKFEVHYQTVFDPKTMPTKQMSSGPYDAFYALAYAIVALGERPITGPAIALALPRIVGPGPRIDVGPGGILAATRALGRGESIDLVGAITSLDFDPVTGDPTFDFSITCLRPGRTGPQSSPSGLVWDGRGHKVTGASRCR